MIPWIYHRLTKRDQATDLLRIVSRRQAASGLLATLVSTYQVPAERSFLLSRWHVFGAGGGAQTFNSCILTLTEATGSYSYGEYNLPVQRNSDTFSAVTGSVWLEGAPALIVPPETIMTVTAFFNAAALANAITVSLNGILIPHGTFSE